MAKRRFLFKGHHSQSTQVSQGNDFSPPPQSESKETHP